MALPIRGGVRPRVFPKGKDEEARQTGVFDIRTNPDREVAIMYEEYFTEEHRILRESVRKFVEKEIKPHIDRWEDEELFPAELYKRCADEGFLGLGYPEAYGGTPCDRFMSIVFTEEMIRSGSVGLVAGLGSHTIAMPPVIHLGTEEQKQRFLAPVLRGEKLFQLLHKRLEKRAASCKEGTGEVTHLSFCKLIEILLANLDGYHEEPFVQGNISRLGSIRICK